MRFTTVFLFILVTLLFFGDSPLPAQHILEVYVDQMGPRISPLLYGIFFEDINHAVDGGLYAELLRNGSFEHTNRREGWVIERGERARATIASEEPLNRNNPNYLKVELEDSAVKLVNTGYDGIPLKRGEIYLLSFYTKGDFSGKLSASLVKGEEKLAETDVVFQQGIPNWQKIFLKLSPKKDVTDARLVVLLEGTGCLLLDMFSLMSEKNWHGMREDLLRMLESLRPSFVRFPGGCLVEGDSLENAYRWKETIGPVEERRSKRNLWGYHQSFGIGFYEYLLLCERLGAKPLPIFNAGMSCQVRSGTQYCPADQLDEWIQDVLDFLEFANGSVDTPWGAVRASLGHPEPFNVEYIGIGNENWGPPYHINFEKFRKAIKEKYPNVKIVFSGPPSYEGTNFRQAWKWAKENDVEIFDEHIYASPEWFLANTDRYDTYDRNGPKVLLGEYAAHTPGRKNNLQAALAEAAFMTGLERNSDVVIMASYAPLFNRVGWSQWVPDLIWFDGYRVFGTPSYYVQKIFSENRGDVVVRSTLTNEEYRVFGYRYKHLYHVVTYDQKGEELIIKVVNPWPEDKSVWIDLKGKVELTGEARIVVLTSADQLDENSFEELKVVPKENVLFGIKNPFEYTCKAFSVNVIRLKLRR